MRNTLPLLLGVVLIVVTAITVAQTPRQPETSPAANDYGTMVLESNLGSYVLEGEGRVEITFTGTLLVYRLEGSIDVTGDVREEFEGMGRRVWFGTGRAVIEGKWRKVQWFGTGMNTTWVGHGFAHVFGEYDAEGADTGTLTVDDLPPRPWHTTGTQHFVPATIDPNYEEFRRAAGMEPDGRAAPPVPDDHDSDPHAGHSH